METNIINNNSNELSLNQYLNAIENTDRACSTVLENSISIFLPLKRIDKSAIYKKFIENGNSLTIIHPVFEKIEIRNRLLGQIHKDILEVLLTSVKIHNKDTKSFSICASSYYILKRLGLPTGNKAWLEKKIREIADCRLIIDFKDTNKTFNFGFISSILEEKLKGSRGYTIRFSPEYTHFLAKSELLDYSNYVNDILTLKSPLVKAIVRYMLINNGNNSQIKISNLLEKLQTNKIMSSIEIKRDLKLLRNPETLSELSEKFGITLSGSETLVFNTPNKPHYFMKPLF